MMQTSSNLNSYNVKHEHVPETTSNDSLTRDDSWVTRENGRGYNCLPMYWVVLAFSFSLLTCTLSPLCVIEEPVELEWSPTFVTYGFHVCVDSRRFLPPLLFRCLSHLLPGCDLISALILKADLWRMDEMILTPHREGQRWSSDCIREDGSYCWYFAC